MLDMGFIRDIRKIVALLPARRQTLLFSATFSDDIRRLARDPAASTRPRSRSRRATPPRSWFARSSIRVDRERKRDLLTHLVGADGSTRRSSSPARSTGRTGLPSSSTATASPPPRSTATRASRSGSGRSPTSRTAASRSSSRPTSPRAASTSTSCRTSSTTSCRWSPRTTSTGSAGPGGPVSTAMRSRWSASTRHRSSGSIERLLRRSIPWRSSPASSRTARSRRSRSDCAPPSTRAAPDAAGPVSRAGGSSTRRRQARPRSAAARRCVARGAGRDRPTAARSRRLGTRPRDPTRSGRPSGAAVLTHGPRGHRATPPCPANASRDATRWSTPHRAADACEGVRRPGRRGGTGSIAGDFRRGPGVRRSGLGRGAADDAGTPG